MINRTFIGPPTSEKDATLYHDALETLRFVKSVRNRLESLDNQKGIDLNSAPGLVVVDRYLSFDDTPRLVGTDSGSADGLLGVNEPTKMTADVRWEGQGASEVSYQENEGSVTYQLVLPPHSWGQEGPRALTVVEDKASGVLRVEQDYEFPWQFSSRQPCLVTSEREFTPGGPSSLEDAARYRSAIRLVAVVENRIGELRSLDNQPGDLNPEPGKVVMAGWRDLPCQRDEEFYEDNPPNDAWLRFDPTSGQVQEFTQGFGEHRSLTYRREGEVEIYEGELSDSNHQRVEMRPDGTLLAKVFESVDMKEVNFAAFSQESRVVTSLLPRVFSSHNAKNLAIQTLSVAATIAVGLTLGPAMALITALGGAVFSVFEPSSTDIRVRQGISRFEGKTEQEKLSNARKVFAQVTRPFREPSEAKFWELPQGTSSKELRKMLLALPTNGRASNVAILVESWGEPQEPALVVVNGRYNLPVRLEPEGMQLPGGSIIPYQSIRAVGICDSPYIEA